MPRNGSGTYSLPEAPFVPQTTISSTAVNDDFNDIATALTGSLATDGQSTMTGALKGAAGSAAAPGYTFSGATNKGFYNAGTNEIGVAIAGTQVNQFTTDGLCNTNSIAVTMPIGSVMDFAGSTAPTGWLLCYGQSLARAGQYASLFAVIGTTYGAADGAHFSLPDCRGRAPFGKDDMGGSAAGRITVAGGNFDATVLGGTGGRQNNVLLQTDLPDVTVTVSISTGQGSHTHTAITQVTTGSTVNSLLFNQTASTVTGLTNTINNATLPAMTGTTASLNGGVAQTNVATLSNAIIFNKIIFAGA